MGRGRQAGAEVHQQVGRVGHTSLTCRQDDYDAPLTQVTDSEHTSFHPVSQELTRKANPARSSLHCSAVSPSQLNGPKLRPALTPCDSLRSQKNNLLSAVLLFFCFVRQKRPEEK